MEQNKIKKYSFKFIMSLILLSILIPFLILTAIFAFSRDGDILSYFTLKSLLPILIFSIFFAFLFWAANISWGHLQSLFMKRTFKNKVKGIFPYSDYYFGSYNYIFINAKTGKIGIITSMNPCTFQIISADAITKWMVDTRPFGRNVSRGVRLVLLIGKQRIGIETLITNGSLLMSSNKVQDAIKQAKDIGHLLEVSKENAIAIKNGTYDSYNDINSAQQFDEHGTNEDYRVKYRPTNQ